MKKLFAIASVAAVLSGVTALGQGYFAISGPVGGAWDAFTTVGTAKRAATINIGFLWASGSSATPLIGAIGSSTATNGSSVFSLSAAWNAILNDPNFHMAVDANNSTAIVTPTAGNGAWQYKSLGVANVPVSGTAAGAYTLYIIGWDKTYATAAAAAAAGSALGWSAAFNYNAVDNLGTPSSPATSITPFGVTPVVPEPGTFALAGLGVAALVAFRRRK